jgi:branched-chain amino acid transport system substrate-binding protein
MDKYAVSRFVTAGIIIVIIIIAAVATVLLIRSTPPTTTLTTTPITTPPTTTLTTTPITTPPTTTPSIQIKIGLLFPLTGSMAALGTDQMTGARIAIDLINEMGGISGKYKITYVIADSQSDPKVAASEAERLITIEKVNLIIGSYASPLALAASEVANRYKTVYYEVGAVTDSITLRNFTYLLRNQPIGGDYGIVAGLFLKDVVAPMLGKNPQDIRVAIINEDGPYGTSVGVSDEKMAKSFGFNVVLHEAYSASATDLSSLILKLKDAKPDVILATGYYTDTVLFFRQAKELGLKFKVYIGHGAGAGLPATWQALGKDMEYVFNIDPPPPPPGLNLNLVSPEYRNLISEFVKRFTSERGYPPLTHAFMGFGNTLPLLLNILPLAIEKYGNINSDSILKAAWELTIPDGKGPMLYGVKFSTPANPEDTILGKIGRPDKPELHIGQNIYARPVVMQWINGSLYIVYPKEWATRSPVIPLPPQSPYAP